MYEWERDALGIDTLGEIKGGVRVRVRVAQPEDDPSTWWVSALFAPEIWRIWRVGLLRRPVRLGLREPIELPDSLELMTPDDLPDEVRQQATAPLAVKVCPVVMAGSALGFLMSSSADTDPPLVCNVYAPTGLRTRLGLDVDQEVWLHVLPAVEHHPELRRQAARGD